MDEKQARTLDAWLARLPAETAERHYLLLDELCRGLDVSKREQFGSLRSSRHRGDVVSKGHPDFR